MANQMVAAQTFVLKTNIHCSRCEKKLKKLLQDVGGVHRISIDAAQGKIEILGTIDPQIIKKLLQKYGKKSEVVWAEPMIDQKDLQITRRPMSPVNNYHGIHNKDVVVQLRKLAEIEGLKSVEVNRDGIKITFKEDFEKEYDFNGKNETFSARISHRKAMHKKYDDDSEHVINNDCNFRGNHGSCCLRNEARYKQYCDGCGCPANCMCMASHGSILPGIPLSGYFPSAPPEVAPIYYPEYYSPFSDDSPRSYCNIM